MIYFKFSSNRKQAAFEPSETFVDPVSKLRVSNPETMIDTDFEYGPQATKWETLQLVNNIPSTYSATSDTTIPFIQSVTTQLTRIQSPLKHCMSTL